LQFNVAHRRLSSTHDSLSDCDLEPSEFFASKYPFESSFDDYSVRSWTNHTINHINLTIQLLQFEISTNHSIRGCNKAEYPECHDIYPFIEGTDYYVIERDEDSSQLFIAYRNGMWHFLIGNEEFVHANIDFFVNIINEAFESLFGKVNR